MHLKTSKLYFGKPVPHQVTNFLQLNPLLSLLPNCLVHNNISIIQIICCNQQSCHSNQIYEYNLKMTTGLDIYIKFIRYLYKIRQKRILVINAISQKMF